MAVAPNLKWLSTAADVGDDEPSSAVKSDFTARTRAVLDHLQATFCPEQRPSAKKRRGLGAAAPPVLGPVGLDGMLAGKSRQVCP